MYLDACGKSIYWEIVTIYNNIMICNNSILNYYILKFPLSLFFQKIFSLHISSTWYSIGTPYIMLQIRPLGVLFDQYLQTPLPPRTHQHHLSFCFYALSCQLSDVSVITYSSTSCLIHVAEHLQRYIHIAAKTELIPLSFVAESYSIGCTGMYEFHMFICWWTCKLFKWML